LGIAHGFAIGMRIAWAPIALAMRKGRSGLNR
jgi:hypothetical protein